MKTLEMREAPGAPNCEGAIDHGYRVAMQLRELAIPALGRMYRPDERSFVFRLRKTPNGIVWEGLSPRYTAITLIGLAAEDRPTTSEALNGHSPAEPADRLAREVRSYTNLGDVALTLWALAEFDHSGQRDALARLRELVVSSEGMPVVELAWTVTALATCREPGASELMLAVRRQLLQAFNPNAGVFPHVIGKAGRLRAHVACFADQVYPIQALSRSMSSAPSAEALDAAETCARRICSAQGEHGQWWWHYDSRTGSVIEGYPVYAVHQDSMAPMALLALTAAGGADFSVPISKGFAWLESSPELNRGTLIDRHAGLIWRKVARREPGRSSRYIQATAAAVHPRLRVPAIDSLFPAVAIDFEDRPYHLGWLLLTCRLLREART